MQSRLTTFVAFFLTATQVGCSDHSISPPDTISTATSSTITTINPLYATDAAGQHISELIYFPLVVINDALEPEPYLAKMFKVIGDKEILFTLRENCQLHDGTPITAQIVADSIKPYLDERTESPHTESLKSISDVKIHSKYAFSLILNKADPSILAYLPIIKIFKATAAASPSDAEGKHLIGSGSFIVKKFKATELELARTKNGCMPTPQYSMLKVKTVRDDLSRYLKLIKGELDIVLNEMNYRKIKYVEENESSALRAISGPGIGYNYLAINFQSPKLKDPRVRRALALSFDLSALIKFKSLGYAKQATSILPPGSKFANKNISPVKRDLALAKKLLDQAGYYNGENKKPRLEITLKTSSNNAVVENATVLSAQAKEAGISLIHRAYEWGIFYKDVKSGNTETYLLRWVGVTDPGIYTEVFHSGAPGKSNRTAYSNKEMDALLEKAQSTLNPEQRKNALDRIQAIAASDLPYINLWHNDNAAIFRREISQVQLYTTGSWRTFLGLKKETAQ